MQMQIGAGKAGRGALPSRSHLEFAMHRLLASAGRGGICWAGRQRLGKCHRVGQGGEGRQIPYGSQGELPGGGDGSGEGAHPSQRRSCGCWRLAPLNPPAQGWGITEPRCAPGTATVPREMRALQKRHPGTGLSSCLEPAGFSTPEMPRCPVPPRKSHLPSLLQPCACQKYGSCGHSSSQEEPEHSTGRESHVKNALVPS